MKSLTKFFSVAVLSMLVVGSMADNAEAGGKNKDGCITVINNLPGQVFALVDASATLQASLNAATATQAEVTAEGGKVLNPGERAKFTVKPGAHTAVAASVIMGGLRTKSVTVANGQNVDARTGTFTVVGGGGGGGVCWVAREVYGIENPKWVVFRSWLLNDSPVWFRNLYVSHGEEFAELISDKPLFKTVIRSWMDTKIKHQILD